MEEETSRKMLAFDGSDRPGIMGVFRRTMTFILALRCCRSVRIKFE